MKGNIKRQKEIYGNGICYTKRKSKNVIIKGFEFFISFPRYPDTYHFAKNIRHPRDLTWDRKAGGGKVFGTLGHTDDSLFVSIK